MGNTQHIDMPSLLHVSDSTSLADYKPHPCLDITTYLSDCVFSPRCGVESSPLTPLDAGKWMKFDDISSPSDHLSWEDSVDIGFAHDTGRSALVPSGYGTACRWHRAAVVQGLPNEETNLEADSIDDAQPTVETLGELQSHIMMEIVDDEACCSHPAAQESLQTDELTVTTPPVWVAPMQTWIKKLKAKKKKNHKRKPAKKAKHTVSKPVSKPASTEAASMMKTAPQSSVDADNDTTSCNSDATVCGKRQCPFGDWVGTCEFGSEIVEVIVSDFDAFFNSSGDDVFADTPAGAAGHPGSWASPQHGPGSMLTEQGLQMQLSEGTKLGNCSVWITVRHPDGREESAVLHDLNDNNQRRVLRPRAAKKAKWTSKRALGSGRKVGRR